MKTVALKGLFLVSFLIAAPVGCASSGGAHPAAATTPTAATLDGRTFSIEAGGPPSVEAPKKIDLTFADGMLDSSECRAKGFPPVAYGIRNDGTFRAERRLGDGLDTWTGRVIGDQIEGTFVATKGGATTMNVPFRGHAR